MVYPNRLLPFGEYKLINCDILSGYFLIRSTPDSNVIDGDTKKLRADYVSIQLDHIKDYSTNLLGVFIVDDIFWVKGTEPNQYYYSDWIEGETVIPPNVPTDFNRDSDKGCFYINITDFHNQEIKYTDAKDNEMTAECILKHTPIRGNFWHFSLKWNSNGIDASSQTQSIRRRILTAAKARIIEKAIYKEPDYVELEKVHYYI